MSFRALPFLAAMLELLLLRFAIELLHEINALFGWHTEGEDRLALKTCNRKITPPDHIHSNQHVSTGELTPCDAELNESDVIG